MKPYRQEEPASGNSGNRLPPDEEPRLFKGWTGKLDGMRTRLA